MLYLYVILCEDPSAEQTLDAMLGVRGLDGYPYTTQVKLLHSYILDQWVVVHVHDDLFRDTIHEWPKVTFTVGSLWDYENTYSIHARLTLADD